MLLNLTPPDDPEDRDEEPTPLGWMVILPFAALTIAFVIGWIAGWLV